MKIDRFRINVIVRVLLLGISIFLMLYFLGKSSYLVTVITVGVVLLYEIYGLIRFVERTNRELSRFFESIQEDDFTQSFSGKKLGDSFDDLNKSFSRVTGKFLKLRSEKEEHARYLQTVITHVGTGLISYKENGDVELLNATAKRLLNINSIKNIKSLEKFSKPMVDTLLHLKAGESTSLKVESTGKTVYLSINTTQFKIKDELYTLLSLQDIQPEIEREH
ncbi:MAG: ATP-binding protein, partial [bacterium]|nr:ATP-binding protein [bacterium]